MIFLSLKDVDGLRFEDARKRLIKKGGNRGRAIPAFVGQ